MTAHKEPTKTVYFRLSESQIEDMTKIAFEEGQPILSRWARDVLLREVAKKKELAEK